MKTIKVINSFSEPFMVRFDKGDVYTISDEQALDWIAFGYAKEIPPEPELAVALKNLETAVVKKSTASRKKP